MYSKRANPTVPISVSLLALALLSFGARVPVRKGAQVRVRPSKVARPRVETAFDRQMMDGMTAMDRAMAGAPMTGNPDRDFAAMMIPHHRGAIDMARLELLHGKDRVLRRLAEEIIVSQQQEIVVMKRQLAKLSAALPAAGSPH